MKTRLLIFLLLIIVSLPLRLKAHTSMESDPGIISNLLALGIVLLSIVIFLVVNKLKSKKRRKS